MKLLTPEGISCFCRRVIFAGSRSAEPRVPPRLIWAISSPVGRSASRPCAFGFIAHVLCSMSRQFGMRPSMVVGADAPFVGHVGGVICAHRGPPLAHARVIIA